MVHSAVLGFPRIGDKREVKKAVEAYWGDKLSEAELLAVAKEVRISNWQRIKAAGVDFVPSNDFTLYDHVLDHCTMFNAVPSKYYDAKLSPLDLSFAMGRGRQRDGVDLPACEMNKYLGTNYHYIVPEVSKATQFKLCHQKPVDEYLEAKAAGIETRPAIFGPLSFLLMGKTPRSGNEDYEPITLLDQLVPVYVELIKKLVAAGVKSLQLDEPGLVLDSADSLGKELIATYTKLAEAAQSVPITITTFFGSAEAILPSLAQCPVHAVHLDLTERGKPEQIKLALDLLKPTKVALSLGLVSGRNVWKNDMGKSLSVIKEAVSVLGEDRVIVATSSSLLHTPISLAGEIKMPAEQKDWFSFALEKCEEVSTLAKAVSSSVDDAVKQKLEVNAVSIKKRRDFEAQSDASVRERLSKVTPEMYNRKSPFAQRRVAQSAVVKLPKFPTTTIGSFPQTQKIRVARSKFTKGEITAKEYDDFIAKEIEHVVRFQESCGLDLLVHGEAERNDMVMYFGEQLKGFVFTENAWVQSYGSRYVRPPIIVADVARPSAMTTRWSAYAQSLSKLPVKGMLTGPVTILAWSFPRIDVSREVQSRQLALALRDEVCDLEKAGIFAIQVDEPAIREGMPLRKSDWDEYLHWAVDSFKLATAGVEDRTQTHSHFCYSDFNEIMSHIARLDADVISIEASKSDHKLLKVFASVDYSNQIGPGVYDIHSPRVPSQQEIQQKIADTLKAVNPSLLFINPDCGLKTRAWPETEASLKNMVAAAKWARETYKD
ncbi:methionine-synthesizing 5- methyltetrahydropteroyltriglutamate--homocysteine methyltransferase [Puccinia graminis f. sp. tritici]|uniref:5-methyltetrahydropteroyltriglutamate--homocysteine S-methyltransferase n=2 Tax=Puccinia graminis f. sp. tritici TaxID=56615 RepID=E3JVZ2_PUCGT|nr:5-methyltetrahydropteroyltriglutamate-homocysteine methyltransferase [Puccinia graminis f. sp. tritici CRL 75-36-700-3]KAA1099441.1 methionine-synthesizing 5- methyltetrahydropteroyltriglutamate--homocysteine methyltransferase [Puccinia graminis f. sp. tritici]EFP76217.2 5-methyltetrahydropteroyltriglutamate-homocysteine methyltransferase [Puccinia graminis f. sp. tritici CRL 75-36-700-3]KAA1117437.1 methionine-synthesizing 5- methyltetrahydropteroyltriglutamate--homocysteine methyltransferas